MINTAKQLKDLIRNLSKKKSADAQVLGEALHSTAKKRETEQYLSDAADIFNEVQNESSMQKLWYAYQKKFTYASDIAWDTVMESTKELHNMSRG